MSTRWPQYEIPPVGMLTDDDMAALFSLIEDEKLESIQERIKWIKPVRDVCLDLFYCGESPRPSDDKSIPNHIRNNCIRVKDAMLKEPPATEVKPLDDGGEALAWYWNGPAQLPMAQVDPLTGAQMADPMTGQPAMGMASVQNFGIKPDAMFDGQMVAEPFDQMTASHLSQICQQNGWPQNWVIGVDAKLLGDIYQKPFDCYWKDCHATEWVDSFASMMIKSGWETGQIQYDDQGHFSLETIPASQVFPDVRHQYIWDMDRFIVTRVYKLGEAQRLFPKQVELLAEKAKPGLPETSGTTDFGYRDNRDFKSKIVTLTTRWRKDQPMPDWKSEDQAIQQGLAVEQLDQPMLPPEQAQQQIPLEMPEPIRSVVDAQTGEPLETNDDGMVWHESWGFRNVLRQTVLLDKELIEDDECPWPGIPIIHAACIGVEDNPYGYGLPWAARHPQKTYSRATRSIDRNTDFYGNAASWLPADLHASMVKQFGKAFIEPNDCLSIDRASIPASGKFDPFIQPPEIPESLIVARRETKADLDEIMGTQDAMRGEPVTPDASGKLQAEATQQAMGLISAMSKNFQGALGYLADLMLHPIIHRLPVDDLYRTCRKVRKEVLAAIQLRHAPEIKWQTNVTLAAVAGMQRDRKRQELLELNARVDPASGLPLADSESVQEAHNLDPELIRQRNERGRQQAQEAMMQTAQAQQAAGVAPTNGKKNGNPNRFGGG